MRPDELDAFARAHLSALGHYAHLLTGDRDTAADLVQDALLQLARARPRVRSDWNPLAYAKTAMLRLHVSALRRAGRWSRAHSVLRGGVAEGHDGGIPVVDVHLGLRGALDGLSAVQRAVIVLTYFDDADDETIARLLRRRRGTVRVLRHRALASMRARLEASEVDLDHAG